MNPKLTQIRQFRCDFSDSLQVVPAPFPISDLFLVIYQLPHLERCYPEARAAVGNNTVVYARIANRPAKWCPSRLVICDATQTEFKIKNSGQTLSTWFKKAKFWMGTKKKERTQSCGRNGHSIADTRAVEAVVISKGGRNGHRGEGAGVDSFY